MDDARRHAVTWVAHGPGSWSATGLVLFGTAFAIYLGAVGYGQRLAGARVAASTAELTALLPDVPPAANAALIWRRAHGELVGFARGAAEPRGALPDADWRDPLTYAADAPARRCLRDNAPALATAELASGMTRFDWDVAGHHDLATQIQRDGGDLALILSLAGARACVAAHDNDWPLMLRSLRLILAAADQLAQGPGVMAQLRAQGTLKTAFTALRDAMGAPAARPTPVVLAELAELAARCQAPAPDLVPAFTYELHLGDAIMDHAGGGDFSGLFAESDRVAGEERLGAANFYSAIYPWDRALFDRMTSATIATLRSAQAAEGPVFDVGDGVCHDPVFLGFREYGAISISSMLLVESKMVVTAHQQRGWRWRVAGAGLAVLAYAVAHQGQWPDSLAQAGLSTAASTDPYDPEHGPLRYQVLADGTRTVWSVGANHREETIAAGRRRKPGALGYGDDIRFVLHLGD